jgi:energy-coupling factor transporter ATP-binding protein EcfA2
MLNLTIENIRTFVRRQTFALAPLTVLTGENSSGKSTLLAVISALLDPEGFPFSPSFNRAPYSLGTYDTIASYKGGKFGRAKSFTIGYLADEEREGLPEVLDATYRELEGQAHLARVYASRAGAEIEITINEGQPDRRTEGLTGTLRFKSATTDRTQAITVPPLSRGGPAIDPLGLLLRLSWPTKGPTTEADLTFLNEVRAVARRLVPGRATSLAPIRTKPERVYFQPTDVFEPTGDHIPFVLDRLLRNPEGDDTQVVLKALLRYARESGLFEKIKVRRLGQKVGEPFQVMVSVGGRMRNLIDVGYGISQALPVVVQMALASPREFLLIQQPEVHLHPRAQASLGSLFADLVHKGRKRVVVETHSDYIIDRLRQEVAGGRLSPDAIRILFLERADLETTIHSLSLDSSGNIKQAPSSYRAFFLEEQTRLFTRTEP